MSIALNGMSAQELRENSELKVLEEHWWKERGDCGTVVYEVRTAIELRVGVVEIRLRIPERRLRRARRRTRGTRALRASRWTR